jgi:hypothetical protein
MHWWCNGASKGYYGTPEVIINRLSFPIFITDKRFNASLV